VYGTNIDGEGSHSLPSAPTTPKRTYTDNNLPNLSSYKTQLDIGSTSYWKPGTWAFIDIIPQSGREVWLSGCHTNSTCEIGTDGWPKNMQPGTTTTKFVA
jgi:hypothetical protein